MMQIPISPRCLTLGFLEQHAVAIIRVSRRSIKGQVVHWPADIAENIGDLLPFPKCYEFMAIIRKKSTNNDNELRTTVRYSVSVIQILKALEFLFEHHTGYNRNKQILPLKIITYVHYKSQKFSLTIKSFRNKNSRPLYISKTSKETLYFKKNLTNLFSEI
jgi:hypothetical protein